MKVPAHSAAAGPDPQTPSPNKMHSPHQNSLVEYLLGLEVQDSVGGVVGVEDSGAAHVD